MNADSGTIAVTGASGYLGRHVMARLRAVGVDAVACPSRASGLNLIDRAAVAAYFVPSRFATVIHCAALVPKTSDAYGDEAAGAASLAMTENLIAARVAHIVFASSMTVYPAETRMPVREEDASDALSGYAGFKRRAEHALCAAPASVATILRLPGLFGAPRTDGLLHNAAEALSRGVVPSLPKAPPLWAALHVEDAAELLVRAAVKLTQETKILNAGYGVPMSVTLTVAELAALFGLALHSPADAPVFEMELSRLALTLGVPSRTLAERLAELAAAHRIQPERACA